MSIERKVLMSKAMGPRFEHAFFVELQEAILDGYRVITDVTPETPRMDRCMRNYQGNKGYAVLYRGEADVVEVVDAPDVPSEDISAIVEPTPDATIPVEDVALEAPEETVEAPAEVVAEKAPAKAKKSPKTKAK